jgi:hypothetical protein
MNTTSYPLHRPHIEGRLMQDNHANVPVCLPIRTYADMCCRSCRSCRPARARALHCGVAGQELLQHGNADPLESHKECFIFMQLKLLGQAQDAQLSLGPAASARASGGRI